MAQTGNPNFGGLSPESSRGANPKKRGYSRVQFAHMPSWWIYNVSNHPYRREMGGTGNFYIAACQLLARVSEPLEIAHPHVEEYATDSNKIMGQYFNAEDIAKNIVTGGIGGVDNNLENEGVFTTTNNPPTNEEIEKAVARYQTTCVQRIKSGDKKYNEGNEQQINIEERVACAYMKANRPWAKSVTPQQECPNCQEYVAIGAATHSCGAVLDWDKAVKLGLKTPEERDRALGKTAAPDIK